MKLLYIVNTIPEFRICFFEEISSRINVVFGVTHPERAEKTYGVGGETEKLSVINFTGGLFARIRGIKSEIKNGDYDKIVLPPADSVIEIIEGLAALQCAKRNKKEIYTYTEKWEPPIKYQSLKKRLKNYIQGLAYGIYFKNSKCCIAQGTKAMEYIISKGTDIQKVKLAYMTSIPPEVSEQKDIRELLSINNDVRIVFCLARMIPRKGIDVLIDAVKILSEKRRDFILVLGGEGPLKEDLQRQVESYNLSCVNFLGMVKQNERSSFYSQSDLFVLPSKIVDGIIEGWGLPVNESLYCYTPVVATTAVGSAYDLLQGKCGMIVEQGDANELADAIEKMLDSKRDKTVVEEIDETNKKYSLLNMSNEFLDAIVN